MLAKIKLFLIAAGGVVMTLLYALLQKEKAARAKDELGDEQAARQVEAKAHRETLDGLQKENEIREKDDSDTKPGHFT